MGRPSNWNGPTRAIRVPEHLAQHLLAIARQLDSPQPDNVQNPARRYLVSWGEEQYLLEDPGNLSPKDHLAVEQAVDRFWRATAGMSQDEHLYVLGELASQWGRRIDA